MRRPLCAAHAHARPALESQNNGINKNVALCVNPEGPPKLLKALIASKALRAHLHKA